MNKKRVKANIINKAGEKIEFYMSVERALQIKRLQKSFRENDKKRNQKNM